MVVLLVKNLQLKCLHGVLQAVASTPQTSISWRRSATSEKETKKVDGLCKAKENEAGAFEELGHLFSALQARRFSTFVGQRQASMMAAFLIALLS